MDFPLLSTIYLQQIYISAMWKKRRGVTSHAGVFLSPMSHYHNADGWVFLKQMIMIEHMKMMQMFYLGIRSMLLSGQVPYRTKSIASEWAIPEKKHTEGLSLTYYFEKKADFFFVFLGTVPLEIPGKTKLHPQKFGKIMCVTSLKNFQAKKPRPLENSHEFFLVSLRNSTLFLINPWKFCMLFL